MIGLHSGALYAKPYGYYLHALIFRLGVPFFFLCAGYFLGRKTTAENRKQVFGAYIKKLLPTYFLWNAFYVPYSLYISNNLSAASLLNGIWWTITMQSATVMWFVGALIWSVIILLHFADEKKLPLILAISAAIYVIGLSFNTYNFLFLGTRFEVVINCKRRIYPRIKEPGQSALALIMSAIHFTIVVERFETFRHYYLMCVYTLLPFTLTFRGLCSYSPNR